MIADADIEVVDDRITVDEELLITDVVDDCITVDEELLITDVLTDAVFEPIFVAEGVGNRDIETVVRGVEVLSRVTVSTGEPV